MVQDDEDAIAAIPDAIETEVLQILDGPRERWFERLRELVRRHPEQASAIRTWLLSVGENELR